MPPKRMPPRKEVKEAVVYPASKRKAPPFKPQRPSQVRRIATTESESVKPGVVRKGTAKGGVGRKAVVVVEDDDEEDGEEDGDEEGEGRDTAARAGARDGSTSDSDGGLADDPLAAPPPRVKARIKKAVAKPVAKPTAALRRKPPVLRSLSPDSATFHASSPPPPETHLPPIPSQSAETPQIPQNLLLRLLHEHFGDKKTLVDKEAIQVLQKYVEVFVREAIARSALLKRDKVEKGTCGDEDEGWLEVGDLEGVGGGLVMDF
ncbi:hypothetical protein LTR08_002671 [Meristemomyces frigidus]|nr:hypothetical protein LTR08_002671 [Meristemomyces frigidus]